jgi:tetraacyldisaccharide 4'-kinase
MAAWLAGELAARGRRPAVLSRGYGRDRASGVDDENRLLAELSPGTPVVVDPDRVAGAARAIREHRADVLLLDDGFQHRRLARDLDIVLLDALRPFGGGHLLPRGLLREPVGSLARAGALVMTRSDLVAPERLAQIEQEARRHAPDAVLAHAVHAPAALRRIGPGSAEELPFDVLRERRWGAFCGIGNPDGFRRTLAALGADIKDLVAFPDHHAYRPEELDALLRKAAGDGLRGLVTTEKDAMKVADLLPAGEGVLVAALAVRIEVGRGRDELLAAVEAAL